MFWASQAVHRVSPLGAALLLLALPPLLSGCGGGGTDRPVTDDGGGTDPGDGGDGGGGDDATGPGTSLEGTFESDDPLLNEGDDDDGDGDGDGDAGSDPDPGDPGDAGDPTPPVLSDPEWTLLQNGVLRVAFTTDVPAVPRVVWSTAQDLSFATTVVGPTGLDHQVLVPGLGEGVLHHVQISARSAGGETVLPLSPWLHAVDGRRVEGELRPWFPVTLTFEGPEFHEGDSIPNPFLDRRLFVAFAGPSGQQQQVEGFFDGDGQGGPMGSSWRVRTHFDESGPWSYTVGFREGTGVAASTDPDAGLPGSLHGTTGTLSIATAAIDAPGFLGRGRLEAVGAHYLRFRDGSWFLKGGTDSPENLLGFAGFDNTFDEPGGVDTTGLVDGLHRFDPHVADFDAAAATGAELPQFSSAETGFEGRGLVGALEYLASQGVNSAYFLPMNLGGDGRDTWPFLSPAPTADARLHYDLSKLRQWNLVFEHAQRLGILLHVVLGETEWENEHWLDNGSLGPERKVFYREMIARFGHLLALKWNLGEEANHTSERLMEFAQWVDEVDPFPHPVAFHTHPINGPGAYPRYDEVLGDPRFQATSIQGSAQNSGAIVEHWRATSAAAGMPWVVDFDEQTIGLTSSNNDQLRKEHLWDVYLSGGQLEWYFGYHALPLGGDLRTEDFRTRETMWAYTRIAREFLEALPFHLMEPRDELMTGERPSFGGGEVFAAPGLAYAAYLPVADLPPTLDLSGETGPWRVRWTNPRNGVVHLGPIVQGGAPRDLGLPPNSIEQDWALTVLPN